MFGGANLHSLPTLSTFPDNSAIFSSRRFFASASSFSIAFSYSTSASDMYREVGEDWAVVVSPRVNGVNPKPLAQTMKRGIIESFMILL